MSKEKITTYELFVHFKQGDDFSHYLTVSDGDVQEALWRWSCSMVANAHRLNQLSDLLVGQMISVNADTHMIEFIEKDNDAKAALEEAVKAGLIEKKEWDA